MWRLLLLHHEKGIMLVLKDELVTRSLVCGQCDEDWRQQVALNWGVFYDAEPCRAEPDKLLLSRVKRDLKTTGPVQTSIVISRARHSSYLTLHIPLPRNRFFLSLSLFLSFLFALSGVGVFSFTQHFAFFRFFMRNAAIAAITNRGGKPFQTQRIRTGSCYEI